jgi:hypothetical protein
MRNGWTATGGEDFIAIASNQSVIDLLSKDETVPSVIARLAEDLCARHAHSRSLSRAPGSLLRTKTPRPTLIPLASNCAISEKNVR